MTSDHNPNAQPVPDAATTISERRAAAALIAERVTCPVCGHEFPATYAGVWNVDDGVVYEDSDGRYWGPDYPPEEAFLISCPKCRYTMPEEWFTVSWTPDECRRIRQVLANADLSNGYRRFMTASAVLRAIGQSPYRAGELALRAAWCARANGDAVQEAEALALALEQFRDFLEDSACPRDADEQLVATYLCGEIARRLGLFEVARGCFRQLLGTNAPAPDLQERARQMLLLVERECFENAYTDGVNGFRLGPNANA